MKTRITIALSSTLPTEYSLLRVDAYDLAGSIAEAHIPTSLFLGKHAFSETVGYLANCITRGKEDITHHGTRKLSTCGSNIRILLSRIDPDKVVLRGDYRYDAEPMSKFLRDNPRLELPPIQVGLQSNQLHLLDGHHRYRAYLGAGRDPLAFTVAITNGQEVGGPCVEFSVKI